MTDYSKFLLFLFPTFVFSIVLLSILSFAGLCSISDCMGRGEVVLSNVPLGVMFIFLGNIPGLFTIVSCWHLFRQRPLGSGVRFLGWTICLSIGFMGCAQVFIDLGDAWAGVTMVLFSACLGGSIRNFPFH